MRVVLADDAVLFREALASALSAAGFEVVGQAGEAGGLMRLVRTLEPDVAVVDVRMPPTRTTEGLEAAERIRAEHPTVGLRARDLDGQRQRDEALLGAVVEVALDPPPLGVTRGNDPRS